MSICHLQYISPYTLYCIIWLILPIKYDIQTKNILFEMNEWINEYVHVMILDIPFPELLEQ